MPLLWELHELPFDFYRYTPPGLEHLLRQAGFGGLEVTPRGDVSPRWRSCWTTWLGAGQAADGLDPNRVEAQDVLGELSRSLHGWPRST